MNILVFHQFYTRLGEAGISRFNLFAPYWQKEGAKLTVVTGAVNYMTGQKEGSCGLCLFSRESDGDITMLRAYSSAFGLGYRTFLGRMLSYISFMCTSFIAGLMADRPDVIITSSPPLSIGVVAALVSLCRGVPLVFEIRDLWPDEPIELGFIKNKIVIKFSYLLEQMLYKKAALIVVNSPGLKEFLVEKKHITPGKIGIIVNPIEFDLAERIGVSRDAMREKLGWDDAFVVLYSGAHSAVYDFDMVLDIAKEYAKSRAPILFAFVGDGRQKPHLLERVQKEHMNNVRLLPPVPKKEIYAVVAAADVGIVPLKRMGLLRYVYATKLFDYMTARRPIIVGAEGVSAELVCSQAKCGLCIPSGDAASFKEVINKLYTESKLRKELGENGYQFAREHLRAGKLALEYWGLLKPVVVPKGEAR